MSHLNSGVKLLDLIVLMQKYVQKRGFGILVKGFELYIEVKICWKHILDHLIEVPFLQVWLMLR